MPEPFFLWIHLFDAHSPPRAFSRNGVAELAADATLRRLIERRGIDPTKIWFNKNEATAKESMAKLEREIVGYDNGLRQVDDVVGTLVGRLEARASWPRTTSVFTGDHGEGLGQHDQLWHDPVWREGTHVPFILRVPGLAASRVATLVSSVDVLATAIAATPGLPSHEFFAQTSGQDARFESFEERAVFSMSLPAHAEYVLATPRWRWT